MMNILQHYYQGKYPQLVMFDLDGTLLNTVPDITVAVNKTLQELGLSSVSEDKIRLWVGNGAQTLIRRALTDGDDSKVVDQALWDEAYKISLGCYPYRHDAKYLYPGVKPFLEAMQCQSVKMAIVTNKPAQFVEPSLKDLAISHYFQWFIGGDTLPQKKPAPEPLLYVLNQAGVSANDALFIGDSRSDVRAAKAAHVPCAALTYGYNHGESIAHEHPTWVIDDLNDLLKVFVQ